MDVCEKIAPPIPARRRASELPPSSVQTTGKAATQSSGIVCTNTDLLSIMNSLKSTASKALQQSTGRTGPGSSKTTDSLPVAGGAVDRNRRDVLRTNRSNSVDVANVGATAAMAVAAAAGNSTRNWFRKMSARSATAAGPRTEWSTEQQQRPATIGGGGEYVVQKSPVVVTFADERPKVSLLLEPIACKPDKQLQPPPPPPPLPTPVQVPPSPPPPPPVTPSQSSSSSTVHHHVVDGKRSKCDDVVVNAEVLGTAIEGFLAAKKSGDSGEVSPTDSGEQPPQQTGGKPAAAKTAANEPNNRTCDTSICSSLKDLFVK